MYFLIRAIVTAAKNVSAKTSEARSIILENENSNTVFSVDILQATNVQPVDVKVDTINEFQE
jgi:hypothetical protein